MASLDVTKRKRLIPTILLLVGDLIFMPIIVFIFNAFMIHNLDALRVIQEAIGKDFLGIYISVFSNKQTLLLFLALQGIILLALIGILFPQKTNLKDNSQVVKVANFEIPKAVGRGQMGTSRFTTDTEKKKIFSVWKDGTDLSSGGMVIGVKKDRASTYYYYDKEDTNTLIIGTTRSGKSRREYLPSIYLLANSGESLFVNDPKGELFIYTYKYLEDMGYRVINIDFRNPEKSHRYNYLEYINREVKQGNRDKAIEMIWDMVSLLVEESKGERLWSNGEASVLAAAISYIVFEAPDEKYKNLTNVYYLIANMCKVDDQGKMKFSELLEVLDIDHPARAAFAVAELAPSRTRGSFFTSALATLRLFTDSKVAYMTSETDIDLNIIAKEKVALFCTIPDEKKTRHVLSTLLIDQLYVNLVDISNNEGGRLTRRVNMLIDEFGNLPKINDFQNKLTVCLGRGIRFIIAIQGIGQLYNTYGKDVAEIITSNCHNWIYLLTSDEKSAEIISNRTGSYTVQTKSVSSSTNVGGRVNNLNVSSSANMSKRNLLTPDEVTRLQQPYSLVLKVKEYPSIFELPDISQLKINKKFGMGDRQHNIELAREREMERKARVIERVDIWNPMIFSFLSSEEKDLDENDFGFM